MLLLQACGDIKFDLIGCMVVLLFQHSSYLRRQASKGNEEGLDSRPRGNDNALDSRTLLQLDKLFVGMTSSRFGYSDLGSRP